MTTKTPYQVLGAQFSGGAKVKTTYYYRAPADIEFEVGDRIVVANSTSFAIPTVVSISPPFGVEDDDACDWIVQKVDDSRRQELIKEYSDGE